MFHRFFQHCVWTLKVAAQILFLSFHLLVWFSLHTCFMSTDASLRQRRPHSDCCAHFKYRILTLWKQKGKRRTKNHQRLKLIDNHKLHHDRLKLVSLLWETNRAAWRHVAPSAGHSPLASVWALDSLPTPVKCPSPNVGAAAPAEDKNQTDSHQETNNDISIYQNNFRFPSKNKINCVFFFYCSVTLKEASFWGSQTKPQIDCLRKWSEDKFMKKLFTKVHNTLHFNKITSTKLSVTQKTII